MCLLSLCRWWLWMMTSLSSMQHAARCRQTATRWCSRALLGACSCFLGFQGCIRGRIMARSNSARILPDLCCDKFTALKDINSAHLNAKKIPRIPMCMRAWTYTVYQAQTFCSASASTSFKSPAAEISAHDASSCISPTFKVEFRSGWSSSC